MQYHDVGQVVPDKWKDRCPSSGSSTLRQDNLQHD